MRNRMVFMGTILLAGGCTGIHPNLSWTDPGASAPESEHPAPTEVVANEFSVHPNAPPLERPFRFKCEDEAMRFENSPLKIVEDERAALSIEKTSLPLPGSLMEPWRAF